MQERTLQIKNQLGLHARAAATLVNLIQKYQSDITIYKDDQEVNGRSIIGLLTLAAECGSSIKVAVEGTDEETALNEISSLVENKFNEE